MKKRIPVVQCLFAASTLLTMGLGMSGLGQTVNFQPERFGVIDVTPTIFSGESDQNSEPSLGVGTGKNYDKFVIHTFDPGGYNYYYTTASGSGIGLPWGVPGQLYDYDATLDWSSGGTCYAALLASPKQIQVLSSSDPTAGVPFSAIGAGTLNLPFEDQPWIRVVNVAGIDHIFVGFNNLSDFPAPSASIHYSLDGGATWNTTLIERENPGYGQDSPAVRLAISKNGQTVYALFQRYNGFTNNFIDLLGDIVLVRDDGYGGAGFGALGNGNEIESGIVLPNGLLFSPISFADAALTSASDVAVDPTDSSRVYVAYTEELLGPPAVYRLDTPVLRVQYSTDSGVSFSPVYSITNASLPSLAVASDHTLGLLYLATTSEPFIDHEVHFLKALNGKFDPSHINDRVLAKIRIDDPAPVSTPYLGDYYTLKAVNFDFFGTFSASGDPRPDDFPSGVYYQRDVSVSGTIMNNFWLYAPGTLVDSSGDNVTPSIDPFFFYDIASSIAELPILIRYPFFYDPIDPLSGITHMVWPELAQNEPQFQLFTSSTLDAAGSWMPASNTPITTANGQYEAPLSGSQSRAFYRLEQNVDSGQFQVFAVAGNHGSLDPVGVVTVPGTANLSFGAVASNNFAVSQWYLDGAVVQSGGSTLTLSNITSEHTLVATFIASNDLAVGIEDIPLAGPPTVPSGTNDYRILIQNAGLNPLTGITMTNELPGTVAFISTTPSQGTVNSAGSLVTANIGSLAAGASATVDIMFVPLAAGSITDTVSVACSQVEPDLANNTATDVTTVISPVTITNQPAPQMVPAGGTATFSVGVTGTPPFLYQWVFNGSNNVVGATSSTLTLTNVNASQVGLYSVSVFQTLGGPEAFLEADSDAAALTVGSGHSSIVVTPGKGRPAHRMGIR